MQMLRFRYIFVGEPRSMDERKLVSIIVPVYNTKAYLCECVYSLTSQTYKNIEIILVNDGSTDDSLEFCRKLEKEDGRIRVVDKKNGGLTSARKAGFEVCKGEYVAFIDSDDYVAEDYVEKHLENIENTNCDMSISSYYVKYDDRIDSKRYINHVFSDEETLKKVFVFAPIHVVNGDKFCYPNFIWLRMYKKELITDACFMSEREYYLEDILFNFEYVKRCKIISVFNAPLYYYRQVATSLTRVYRKNKIYMEKNLVAKIQEYADYYGIDKKERIEGFKYNSFRRCITNASKIGDYKQFKNEVKDYWKECKDSFCSISIEKLSRGEKIFMKLYNMNLMHAMYLYLVAKEKRRKKKEKIF